MRRPARLLLASCLAAAVVSGSGFVLGAEGVESQQELANVKTAKQVFSADWTRLADSYTLQVVIDRTMPTPGVVVDVREALGSVPQNTSRYQPQPIPNWREDAPSQADRDSFFIGNTIANLRNMDPVFCGRTLTATDGRRMVPGQRTQAPVPVPLPPGFRDRRVEVWLLNAGGTQIPNATYTCDFPGRNTPTRSELSVSYGYSVADGAQAVAAAIRIGDDFYIEKLQTLAPPAQP